MSVDVLIHGFVRRFSTHLTGSISGYVKEASTITERFRRILGEDMFRVLERAFEEALRNEIDNALNTDMLSSEFSILAERFWARLSLPLIEASNIVLSNPDETASLEEELASTLAKIIKNTGYRHADDLVYGLSALVDRDLWILKKIREIGFEELARRIVDRASREILEYMGYTIYLAFAWTASTVAVLGIAERCRGENRDMLAQWCRSYAREVEDYVDTLDLLVNDETYGELVKLGVVKE